ncbi:hypothetical protein Tco_0420278, partial [Tanacetum coccineum]
LINSQISAKDKASLGYDSQMNESEVVHSVFNSRESDVANSPVNDRFKTSEGFHTVPPPYTGNYMPSRPELSFAGFDDSVYKTKVSETETSISKCNTPKNACRSGSMSGGSYFKIHNARYKRTTSKCVV